MSTIDQTDELNKLENQKVVLAPEGDFESPAKEFIPGPYYAAADEVIPELGMVPDEVAGAKASSKGKEFPVDRRDFMRLFSASAMFGASSCIRRPEETAIPYVKQPLDHVQGVPTYYATTCGDCASGCGIVVKTREGRPVKLEGNEEHPISQGGLCAMGQASIQGLYHPERLTSPYIRHGKRLDAATWDEAFSQIKDKLSGTSKVGILTGGSTGHRNDFYKEVLKKLGASEDNLYTFEPNSLFACMAKAHEIAFGHHAIPRAELRHAKLIVGVGSDFHEVGISSLYYSKGFAQSHGYNNGNKGKFVQFESHLSNTGAGADTRHVVPPGSELINTLLITKSLFENAQSKGSKEDRARIKEVLNENEALLNEGYEKVGLEKSLFDQLAKEMLEQTSVLLAGGSANFDENSTKLQLAAIMANILIGAYDKTLLIHKGWMEAPVRAEDWGRFKEHSKDLEVLFVIETNPVFSTAKSQNTAEYFKNIPTVISIQSFPNEMDEFAKFVLPNNHYLESWGDEQPVSGFWSARQPAVKSTTNSKQAEDILLWTLAYMKNNLPYKDYRAYLKEKWKEVYPTVGTKVDYETFFKAILRRGFIGKLSGVARKPLNPLVSYMAPSPLNFDPKALYLITPFDHRFQDGRSAHLPVLQEIGDSLTTVAWDSFAAMNPKTMVKLGLKQNQILKIKSSQGELEVAAYPLPGLHESVVVIPRGNGHEDERSTISYKNGVNPLDLIPAKIDHISQQPSSTLTSIKVVATDRWFRLATMQKHNDIANRTDIVKKISLKEAKKKHGKTVDLDKVPDLFPKLETTQYKWGMNIDLSQCNGCGACMVACSLENNVPQVGREQIILGREMHWIRLDRYFYGDVDNPVVTFQPVMCQHCNHAPCEAVCPVFATTHDPEGMNAMTYNRCVGTRYCANACPYKVRRFNWWTHKWGSMGQRLVDRNPRALNPDVTVRTRGVMEKCSFCVGRLRDAKHKAKEYDRTVFDGEVKTACQQTCPSDAITFGNLNDPNSKISRARKDFRAYLMLGGDPEHEHYGLKTLPSVSYWADVTHEEPATGFGNSGAHGKHASEGHKESNKGENNHHS